MNINAIGRNIRSTARNIRNVTAAAIIAATPMTKAATNEVAALNSTAINITTTNLVTETTNAFINTYNTILIKADEKLTGPFTNTVRKIGNFIVGFNGQTTNCVFTGISQNASGDWILKLRSLTDKGVYVNDTVRISGKTFNSPSGFFKVEIRKTKMPTK